MGSQSITTDIYTGDNRRQWLSVRGEETYRMAENTAINDTERVLDTASLSRVLDTASLSRVVDTASLSWVLDTASLSWVVDTASLSVWFHASMSNRALSVDPDIQWSLLGTVTNACYQSSLSIWQWWAGRLNWSGGSLWHCHTSWSWRWTLYDHTLTDINWCLNHTHNKHMLTNAVRTAAQ